MELTLTGFNPAASSASVDINRQQQGAAQREQQQAASADRRSPSDQPDLNRSQQAQRTAESPRIINGEVLSSERSRVSPEESTYQFLQADRGQNRNQQAPTGQPDTRRVSVQQALQNFQQNESLAETSPGPRQVSGIIDEIV